MPGKRFIIYSKKSHFKYAFLRKTGLRMERKRRSDKKNSETEELNFFYYLKEANQAIIKMNSKYQNKTLD